MTQLQQKWSNLKNSERNLLLFGTFFVVIALLYFYVWLPYNQLISNYREQILYTQEDISWLGQVSTQIKQFKAGSSKPVGSFRGSFIDTVDKSIKTNRLNKNLGTLEISSKDKVIVQFNKVSFNRLIKWIGFVKTRYGILVKNIDLQRDEKSELVNARIILKKSA